MSTGRQDTSDYAALFLGDSPLLDTRAPVEFARGAFPGAVNLPLLSDEERASVGICYRQQGQAAAIALGHQLVSGEVKAQRIAAWQQFVHKHPQGYLYCFRGGMRSEICQQWLAESGHPYPRVVGGYKAMRRFLLETIERVSAQGRFIVLAGHTGSAKTVLLNELPNSVDLEGLARHRGSSFGRLPSGQPSQIDFENALGIALLRKTRVCRAQDEEGAVSPVVLEDESRLIGRCALPIALRNAMRAAPVVVVESSLEARVDHSHENYILHKLAEWQVECGEAQGFEHFAQDLRDALHRVRRRLGGKRYRALNEAMEQAIVAHRNGDPEQHRLWIRELLEHYYDPMYRYQMAASEDRVIFRGDHAAVRDWLSTQASARSNMASVLAQARSACSS